MSKLELLEKAACVRCGKPNMNGTKGGRCKACMNKLTHKRHVPGSKERAWNKADGAARRDRGDNGTAHPKAKGRMKDRKAFIKRFQHNEKAVGAKLSPDRKQNDTGYTSSNVRNVPEKLNRGRHHVDGAKLAAWKKRLKKCEIDEEDFLTLVLAKAYELNDEMLVKSLDGFDADDLERLIDFLTDTKDTSEETETHKDS